MEISIEWSELAEKQLKDIYDYYSLKANQHIAKRIINWIVKHVVILYKNPLAGSKEELLADQSEDFRYLVESNYKIIFWQQNELITISTVFDVWQYSEKLQNA